VTTNKEQHTLFLLEEWRPYVGSGEWMTVPSGFTLHTVGQALAFADRRARQRPGHYRIAVYQRTGATEVNQ
jgi:hypothetical protein